VTRKKSTKTRKVKL